MAQNGGNREGYSGYQRLVVISGRVWTTTRDEDLSQNFPGPQGAGQAGWRVGYSYEAELCLHGEGKVIPGAGNRCNRSTWGRRHHLGSARASPHLQRRGAALLNFLGVGPTWAALGMAVNTPLPPSGSKRREQWEPQLDQRNQPDQNGTADALEVRLELELQPTGADGGLHAKHTQNAC